MHPSYPILTTKGFKYTQTDDRMWRKNRQTTPGSNCLGHDINRNWPYKWNIEDGASTNPCAEDFRGKSAGDAPETKALSEFLRKVKAAQGLKLYIDWHSYSQLFMTRETTFLDLSFLLFFFFSRFACLFLCLFYSTVFTTYSYFIPFYITLILSLLRPFHYPIPSCCLLLFFKSTYADPPRPQPTHTPAQPGTPATTNSRH